MYNLNLFIRVLGLAIIFIITCSAFFSLLMIL
ncbi:Uncharacterised protein [Enterobacter kobei]|nr:Uncharacterised protein [Enterobacter kobei]